MADRVPTHDSGGCLNSGVLAPGVLFTVTFTATGSCYDTCTIYDDLGMVGDVVVVP